MTALPTDERHSRARIACLLGALVLVFGAGCAKRLAPSPTEGLLLPLSNPVRWLPGDRDLAAADLAESALGHNDLGVSIAIVQLEAAEHEILEHAKQEEDEDRMLLLALDVVNASVGDDVLYRQASKDLVAGFSTDPALEARLEMAIKDDPLRIAKRRRRDTWERLWARTFNAYSEPLGRTVITGFVAAPASLAISTAHYLASFTNDEPLSTTDRQALALRKSHLREYPNAENAMKLRKQVEKAEKKLAKTMRKRRLREAIKADKKGRPALAIVSAERALYWGPNQKADRIIKRSKETLALRAVNRRRSLDASPNAGLELADPEIRDLANELLLTSATAAPLSTATLDQLTRYAAGKGPWADEASYLLAMAQHEAGQEDEGWGTLTRLSRRGGPDNNMARYASSMIGDPWQDTYLAYLNLKSAKHVEMVKWRFLDKMLGQNMYPNLPRPISLLLETPMRFRMIVTTPVRAILSNWNDTPDFQRPTAVIAYRYLGKHPDGQHSRDLMQWVLDYEERRGNVVAALRMSDFIPGFDAERRDELAELASEQTVAAADRMKRADRRTGFLRQAIREYPDTEAGQLAGERVRFELEEGSPQKIRMTRSFLIENKAIAGRGGLGINPILINDEPKDGELHPRGVTFLGGREIELALLADSGEEDDPPETVTKTISSERLSRLASILDETTRRNQLIDVDDSLEPDPDRDQFIERARLGLTKEPDYRATAQSTYVYRSMRERYGIVRGRESILPFDVVVTGSFDGLSLGAFPRWRMPKQTPDSFLYR